VAGALPTPADVLDAAERLHGRVRATPLERSAWLSEVVGREVWIKHEGAQRTGSFKLRGAINALSMAGPTAREHGVVTASAGNHGLGMACAAGELGVRATVFVPARAAAVKRDRIAAYGARLELVDGGYDAAHRAASDFAAESGALYVHAFSDPAVVAGQGTVGVEIARALPEVATLLVPVGGGGLIGGVGLAAQELAPRARVIGVQTPATSAVHDSLAAGHVVPAPTVPTLCEGLAGDTDEASVRLAREVVDGMVLVPEQAIPAAMRALFTREGVVAEPSGAVAVAALLAGLVEAAPEPVVVVVTGSNVDAGLFARVLLERSTDRG
jgi:threonine dehydratase